MEMEAEMLVFAKRRAANASKAWGSCCDMAWLIAAYCSEENCGCGEASKLGSARRDFGLGSSIVVASLIA